MMEIWSAMVGAIALVIPSRAVASKARAACLRNARKALFPPWPLKQSELARAMTSAGRADKGSSRQGFAGRRILSQTHPRPVALGNSWS